MATTKKTTTTKATTAKKTTTRKKAEVVADKTVEIKENMFEKIAKQHDVHIEHVDLGDGVYVDVKNILPMNAMLELVKSIVDTCVDEDRGEIHFQMFDPVVKMYVVSAYCDIEIPDNIETVYAATCGSGRLYDSISGYIDNDQLSSIWSSCREKIYAKRDMFCSAAAKITVDMLQRINELYEMITNISEDFDGEEVADALKRLGELSGGK